MNSEILLDRLTKAVCFKYSDDPTRPGVTISFLRDGQYYCSVVRYVKNATTKIFTKKVVCNSTGPTLDVALKTTADKFLSAKTDGPKSPVDELSDLLRSGK